MLLSSRRRAITGGRDRRSAGQCFCRNPSIGRCLPDGVDGVDAPDFHVTIEPNEGNGLDIRSQMTVRERIGPLNGRLTDADIERLNIALASSWASRTDADHRTRRERSAHHHRSCSHGPRRMCTDATRDCNSQGAVDARRLRRRSGHGHAILPRSKWRSSTGPPPSKGP